MCEYNHNSKNSAKCRITMQGVMGQMEHGLWNFMEQLQLEWQVVENLMISENQIWEWTILGRYL